MGWRSRPDQPAEVVVAPGRAGRGAGIGSGGRSSGRGGAVTRRIFIFFSPRFGLEWFHCTTRRRDGAWLRLVAAGFVQDCRWARKRARAPGT